MNYASAGVAGLPHLVAEMFRTAAGIDGNHIPYRGAAPATLDVMAGRADFMFNNIVSAMPGIRDGRLRALAVTTRDRDAALPEVPSLYELGYTSIDVSGWYGLLAPAGTGPAIVARLNAELSRILGDADVIRSLRTEGMRPMGSTPEDFRRRIRQDAAGWAAVVRAAGITAD